MLCFGATRAAAFPNPTNDHSHPFSLGDSVTWPQTSGATTSQWSRCLGTATLGATYVFWWGGDNSVYCQPWKFPLPPQAGSAPSSNGDNMKVLGPNDYAQFLDVCSVAGPRPDIYAFYLKAGDTRDVYYRLYSESFNAEHVMAFADVSMLTFSPGPAGGVSAPQQFVRPGRLNGRIVYFDGSFVFVSAGTGAVGSDIVYLWYADGRHYQISTAQAPDSVRSVDACVLSSSQDEVLSVGWLEGQPGTGSDWTGMHGNVTLLDHDLIAKGADPAVHQLQLAPSPAWLGETAGAADLRLVQGGVKGGATGDCLQAFVRTTGLVGAAYSAANWEAVERYGLQLSAGDPLAFGAEAHDQGGYERGVYTTPGSQGYVKGWSVSTTGWSPFEVFPVLDGSASGGVGRYAVYRQYIYWAAWAPVHVEHDNDNKANGDLGTWGCLTSDLLQPVARDTKDSAGNALTTPITYPYQAPLVADPRYWNVLGVIYGVPPLSLQGQEWGDVTTATRSTFSFESKTSQGTTTSTKQGGSAGLEPEFKGVSAGTTYQMESNESKSSDTTITSDYAFAKNDASQDGLGWMICSAPDYQVQRYAREDWAGTAITGSSVVVTSPVEDVDGFTYVPFDMTDPSQPDPLYGSSLSAGMRAHPASSQYSDPGWKTDPLAGSTDGSGNAIWQQVCNPVQLTGSVFNAGTTTMQMSKDQAASQTRSSTISAKLDFLWFKSEYSTTTDLEATTSNGQNMSFSYGLPKPGTPGPGDAKQIQVQAYWLQADSTDAYWIPTALKTNGNAQLPWCIDYRVVSYVPYASSPGARDCSVATLARPARGGQVTILSGGPQTQGARVAAGNTAQVAATPADGYRFVRWRTFGRQVRLGSSSARITKVAISSGGGATIEAEFAPILPKAISVKQLGQDRCDIRIAQAPLARRYAGPPAGPVSLVLGSRSYVVPPKSWRRSGSIFVASFTPPSWTRRNDRCRLTVDTAHDWWTVDIRGAGLAGEFLLACATGQAPIGLSVGGREVTAVAVPVAVTADLGSAPGAATVTGMAPSSPGPVSLRGASLRCTVDPLKSARTRVVLSGVKIAPRLHLLSKSGFSLAINGQSFRLGPFRRVGGHGRWTFSGKSVTGIAVSCVFSGRGALTLTLSGDALRAALASMQGNNVHLVVTNGSRSASGNMITQVRSLKLSKPAPHMLDYVRTW